MSNDPVTMSEAEFAKRVGISRITAWRMRQAGKLPHYRIGRCVRYGEKHVQEFLDNCERRIKQPRHARMAGDSRK